MNAIADREFLKVAAIEGSRPLRIALVSPYDFAYPGGVTSHISGLSDELTATRARCDNRCAVIQAA